MSGARAKGKAAPIVHTAEETARIAEQALADHRAVNPVVLDMREVTLNND